jgi:hypothetical protein
MAVYNAANHYPRAGERVAPRSFAEILDEPIPAGLSSVNGLAGMKLADLDETIWQRVPAEAIVTLSKLVVARVAAACARRGFDQRRCPSPPPGLKLRQLGLEHRTHLCLSRQGFDEDPQLLGNRTIGDLIRIRSFGPRCLVDLFAALETALGRIHRPERLDGVLSRETSELAALTGVEGVRADDHRFRTLILAVDNDAATAKELALRLNARRVDPIDPSGVADRVRQLRERIVAASMLTLEAELEQIFTDPQQARNGAIVSGYYGWGDGRPRTLAEVGRRYGMTRERARQICAKAVHRKNPSTILAPVLDRTLAMIDARLPRSAAELEKELIEAGLTTVGLGLGQIVAAARLLGRTPPFDIVALPGGKLAVPPSQAMLPRVAVEAAKKQVYYHGAASVAEVVSICSTKRPGLGADLAEEALRLMEGFRWLDRSTGWFQLTGVAAHGLPRMIDKMLAVAGRLRVADLARAIGRGRRMWTAPPPEQALLEFCRGMPNTSVKADRIVATKARDLDQALTGGELRLVKILRKRGPVLQRGVLQDLCIADGMNQFSFHAFLSSSPVIAQYGPGVFGLLGAKVSPATIKTLVAKARGERSGTE